MANRIVHDKDPARALGAVEYELHLLATALLLHRRLHKKPSNPSPHPELELAADSIRGRCRNLLEFLTAHPGKGDRITVRFFGLPPRPRDDELWRRLSTYTSHLGWGRTVEKYAPGEAFTPDDGLRLLKEAVTVCIQIHRQQHRFKPRSRYESRHERLKYQLAALEIPYV